MEVKIKKKTKKHKIHKKYLLQPSVHVPRAETRLTVHRSPLVGPGSVERANVKSDVFFLFAIEEDAPEPTYQQLRRYKHWRLTFDEACKGKPGIGGAGWILWGKEVDEDWRQISSGGALPLTSSTAYSSLTLSVYQLQG